MFYAGLILFFALHVFPFFDRARTGVVVRIGLAPYRGLYALIALAGLTLMVLGYDSASAFLYTPVDGARLAAPFVMFAAFTALAASRLPGRLRVALRHPLSIAIVLWSGVHLMMNPDAHSVALFGAFFVYGIASAVSSEQRGKPRPTEGSWKYDSAAVLIGALLAGGAYSLHEYLSGVQLGPFQAVLF